MLNISMLSAAISVSISLSCWNVVTWCSLVMLTSWNVVQTIRVFNVVVGNYVSIGLSISSVVNITITYISEHNRAWSFTVLLTIA